MIINLPKNMAKETTHRYGPNAFKLHRCACVGIGNERCYCSVCRMSISFGRGSKHMLLRQVTDATARAGPGLSRHQWHWKVYSIEDPSRQIEA